MNIKQSSIRKACAKNINKFIQYIEILTADGFTEFRPYQFQAKLLRKFAKSWINRKEMKHNHVVVAPRQCGKTTIAIIYLLWFALFNEQRTIAILANTELQSRSILEKVMELYEHLPDFLKVKITKSKHGRIEFENGSYIFNAPFSSSAVLGKHIDLIVFDEFAYCKEKSLDQFMKSVFPTVSASVNSQVILLSTPHGDNEFYTIYSHAKAGKSSFIATHIGYDCMPGRDEAWKNKIIRDYGIKFFTQEYDAAFILSEPIEEANTITLNINTSPLSKEEAKGLMEKLKQLFSKKLTIEEVEDATYDIKFE